jgi:hypothetical protein
METLFSTSVLLDRRQKLVFSISASKRKAFVISRKKVYFELTKPQAASLLQVPKQNNLQAKGTTSTTKINKKRRLKCSKSLSAATIIDWR